MLKIVGNNSYIVLKETKQSEYKSNEPCLIPKIHCQYKLSFDKWSEKYETEINQIWDSFINKLTSMTISDHYICHYNMTQFKHHFIKLLYKTSDNTYKNYI